MAPMYLVSNEAMMQQAISSGILAAFPSLNYRKKDDLEKVLQRLNSILHERKGQPGNYAVNLIGPRAASSKSLLLPVSDVRCVQRP